mmetsp:Transcript_38263/g.113397  ORF Transcript_38263/g.113397 Transcript_38263/m.113397 type:complete len:259 (+) Transcript_38263:441-1217(+)
MRRGLPGWSPRAACTGLLRTRRLAARPGRGRRLTPAAVWACARAAGAAGCWTPRCTRAWSQSPVARRRVGAVNLAAGWLLLQAAGRPARMWPAAASSVKCTCTAAQRCHGRVFYVLGVRHAHVAAGHSMGCGHCVVWGCSTVWCGGTSGSGGNVCCGAQHGAGSSVALRRSTLWTLVLVPTALPQALATTWATAVLKPTWAAPQSPAIHHSPIHAAKTTTKAAAAASAVAAAAQITIATATAAAIAAVFVENLDKIKG